MSAPRKNGLYDRVIIIPRAHIELHTTARALRNGAAWIIHLVANCGVVEAGRERSRWLFVLRRRENAHRATWAREKRKKRMCVDSASLKWSTCVQFFIAARWSDKCEFIGGAAARSRPWGAFCTPDHPLPPVHPFGPCALLPRCVCSRYLFTFLGRIHGAKWWWKRLKMAAMAADTSLSLGGAAAMIREW